MSAKWAPGIWPTSTSFKIIAVMCVDASLFQSECSSKIESYYNYFQDLFSVCCLIHVSEKSQLVRENVTWATLNSLLWRHNGRDDVSNHDCLLNRSLRRRSKKTWKLRVIGLCEGNLPVMDGFPHKGPITRKKVSIRWRHLVGFIHQLRSFTNDLRQM